MTVPFMYKFHFSHFTPQVRLLFVERRTPKIFGFKNVLKREIRKILSFVIYVKMHLKFSGKQYWSPWNFEKTVWDDQTTDTNFKARLWSISKELKVLWIAWKMFSMYVGGNCCWVPLTLVFCHSFAQCKGIRIQESGIHVPLKKIVNTVPGIWNPRRGIQNPPKNCRKNPAKFHCRFVLAGYS